MKSQSSKALLIFLPVVSLWYIGLFLTVFLWYPAGLDIAKWQEHVIHFSIVYLVWLIVFYAYSLFNLHILNSLKDLFSRLFGAIIICTFLAVMYFYFQPDLLLTPRRFLLVHVLFSSIGIFLWYWILSKLSPRLWQSSVFSHTSMPEELNLEYLLSKYGTSGLIYNGVVSESAIRNLPNEKVLVVLPPRQTITLEIEQELFALRRLNIRFVEYHDFHERLTRTVHLSVLTDLWFLHSVDYGKHALFDFAKRIFDIFAGIAAGAVFLITFPIIFVLIKSTSKGPAFFSQLRVGQDGKSFLLYKYRTMTTDSSSDTWAHSGQKVTWIGRFLRASRLDELPQAFNIIKGDMSIVGPRPEQVNIVEQLREQIPYYDERHIVKPGLTGWAQLHVYASTVEETKRKLQYDLYYVKHRNIFFDLEIIIKTVYNTITMAGR